MKGNRPQAPPLEQLYAVMAQLLDMARSMDSRLSGVETGRRELRVVNNLPETQAGLDTLATVRQNPAIGHKG